MVTPASDFHYPLACLGEAAFEVSSMTDYLGAKIVGYLLVPGLSGGAALLSKKRRAAGMEENGDGTVAACRG
jgi:hypothetical protein